MVVPGLVGATQLVGGTSWACALLESGNVSCWDRSIAAQEATPPTGSIALLQSISGLAGITKISGSGFDLYAVTNEGRVFHVPVVSTFGPAEPVADIYDAVSVAAGHSFACVATRSGTVRCWGKNDIGQLGDGDMLPPMKQQGPTNVQVERALTP